MHVACLRCGWSNAWNRFHNVQAIVGPGNLANNGRRMSSFLEGILIGGI